MLRESSKASGEDYDLTVLTGAGGDGNISDGSLLVEFAEAILGGDDDRLSRSRAKVQTTMGDAALVDAAAIVATFNAIDRIADATGIPIEEANIESTAELRDELGINAFAQNRGEIIDRRTRGMH